MTQFSLFGAAAASPTVDDLGGVLLAGGHWVGRAGSARLSAVVADRWRADELVVEFGERGLLGTESVVTATGGWSVRTAFTRPLADEARRWSRGANEGLPANFALTAAGLRLWAITHGRAEEAGYLLGTARPDTPLHLAAGAQLARLGVAAVAVGVRGRCGWRLTGAKRLRRLGELVGAAPPGAGVDWPR